jgi:hypothetical protein
MLLLGVAPAAANVSFGNASIQVRSFNVVGDPSYNIDRVDSDAANSSTPTTLAVSAASNSNTLLNSGPVRPYLESSSSVSSSAAFTAADQFSFGFTGSLAQSLAPSTLASFASSDNSAELAYDFSLSLPKRLNLVQMLDRGNGLPSTLFFSSRLTVLQLLGDGGTSEIFVGGGNTDVLLTLATPLGPGNYRMFLTHNLINSVSSTSASTNSAALDSQISVAFTEPVTGAVPEPATWLSLILGFGLVGVVLRRLSPVPG